MKIKIKADNQRREKTENNAVEILFQPAQPKIKMTPVIYALQLRPRNTPVAIYRFPIYNATL